MQALAAARRGRDAALIPLRRARDDRGSRGSRRAGAEAEQWSKAAGDTFLEAWLATAKGAVFLPATEEECTQVLQAFLLEKAIYEVAYELNNRPAWLPIPVRGILRLLGA